MWGGARAARRCEALVLAMSRGWQVGKTQGQFEHRCSGDGGELPPPNQLGLPELGILNCRSRKHPTSIGGGVGRGVHTGGPDDATPLPDLESELRSPRTPQGGRERKERRADSNFKQPAACGYRFRETQLRDPAGEMRRVLSVSLAFPEGRARECRVLGAPAAARVV
jgi:hypothetical protein